MKGDIVKLEVIGVLTVRFFGDPGGVIFGFCNGFGVDFGHDFPSF
jgi:hypothetical protein